MEPILQLLKTNSGKTRRETLHGREFIVAPATLIVSGVLNGSQGALYYPPEEVAKEPWTWNGMPLVAYHPQKDGKNVSARDPEILADYQLGSFYRAAADDNLAGEAWFDVELTEAVDNRLSKTRKGYEPILPRLKKGLPIELSTGLFTDNVPAKKGSTFNGKEYEFVARNYRPDHIAVLPDEIGACSNEDGCGINTNTNSQGETDMDRKKIIAFLTSNCDCWKAKEDQEALNKMSDKAIEGLADNAKLVLVVNAHKAGKLKTNAAIAANAGDEGEAAPGVPYPKLAQLLGIDIDPRSDPVGFTNALKAALDEISSKLGGAEPPPTDEEPAPDSLAAAAEEEVEEEEEDMVAMTSGKKSAKEVANRLSKEEQEDLAFARAEKNRRKLTIVNRLVANVKDSGKRTVLAKKYLTKPLPELQEMLQLLPAVNRQERHEEAPALWFGAASPVGNVDTDDDDSDEITAMTPPTMNFEKRVKTA